MTVHPINVMMVTDSLAVGGAEQVAVDLANSLDRTTHKVRFCTTREGGPLSDRLNDDVHLQVLGRSMTWDLAGLLRFSTLVRSTSTDIIHTHGRGTMKFVALGRMLGLIDARHVFHDHFGWLHLDRKAGLDLRVAMGRYVDAYLGVESRLCSWASDAAGMDPKRIFLLRSGVDLSRFTNVAPANLRQRYNLGPDDLLMVMLANMRHPKDHPTLFRAIAELEAHEQRSLRVVLIGSTEVDAAYQTGCEAMIERLGIGPSIEAYGPADDPAPLLAAADAAVLCSKNESGPLVVLEYMASSLPLIATDTGEITHSIRDHDVGAVPAPRDHLSLADALRTMMSMSCEKRSEIGKQNRSLVEERFDQRQVARRIEQIYEVTLGMRGKPVDIEPYSSTGAGTARPRPQIN